MDRNSGGVKITRQSKEKVTKAKEYIENIVKSSADGTIANYEIGKQYRGVLKK